MKIFKKSSSNLFNEMSAKMCKKITIIFLFMMFLGSLSIILTYDVSIEKKDLNTSIASGKIAIWGNEAWVDFRNAGLCTGSGTTEDPYIIEDLVIDSVIGYGIEIVNSDVHFIIENCSISNGSLERAAIRLDNLENGVVRDNNIYNTYYGIRVSYCSNVILSGNFISQIHRTGIDIMSDSHNVKVIENTLLFGVDEAIAVNQWWSLAPCYEIMITGNSITSFWTGILFRDGEHNIIKGNSLQNGGYGIYLDQMNKNEVTNNIIRDYNYGIYLTESICNTISNNEFNNNQEDIFGQQICFEELIIPILVGIFIVIALISISIVLVRRSKRKRQKLRSIESSADRVDAPKELQLKEIPKVEPEVKLEVQPLEVLEIKDGIEKYDQLKEEELGDIDKEMVQKQVVPEVEQSRIEESVSSEELPQEVNVLKTDTSLEEEVPLESIEEKQIEPEQVIEEKPAEEVILEKEVPYVVEVKEPIKEDVKEKTVEKPEIIEFEPSEAVEPSEHQIKESSIRKPIVPKQTIKDEGWKEQEKGVGPEHLERGESKFCTNCGKPILNTWNICAYCGVKIRKDLWKTKPVVEKEEVPSEKELEIPTVESQKSPEIEEIKQEVIEVPKAPDISKTIEKEPVKPKILKNVCPFCGLENPLEQFRCKQCGYKLKRIV